MSELPGVVTMMEVVNQLQNANNSLQSANKRKISEPGVKDLLITRQNALGIAKDIMIASGRCPINPEQDQEFIEQLKKIADQLVAYDWRNIQLP